MRILIKKHLIVAYGSNTNNQDQLDFCKKYNRSPDCLSFRELVCIPYYRLSFDRYSKNRNGGVVNIIKAISHVRPTALFQTDEEGLELLRKKEGVPCAYEEIDLYVVDHRVNEFFAKTFVVNHTATPKHIPPGAEYLRICYNGYLKLGILTKNLMLASQGKDIHLCDGFFLTGPSCDRKALLERYVHLEQPKFYYQEDKNFFEIFLANVSKRYDVGVS